MFQREIKFAKSEQIMLVAALKKVLWITCVYNNHEPATLIIMNNEK